MRRVARGAGRRAWPNRSPGRRRAGCPAAAGHAARDGLSPGAVRRRRAGQSGLVQGRAGAGAGARAWFPSGGANIELLTWGEIGKPGLIFVHGNSAHADWWSFIAPFFGRSLPGRGAVALGHGRLRLARRLQFRDLRRRDPRLCDRRPGLYEALGGTADLYRPFVRRLAGLLFRRPLPRADARLHSRSTQALAAAADARTDWRSGSGRSGPRAGRPSGRWRGPAHRTQPNRVYATHVRKRRSTRFSPDASPGSGKPLHRRLHRDGIRSSARRWPDDAGEGWTWRFDPFLWAKLDRSANGRDRQWRAGGPAGAHLGRPLGNHPPAQSR